MVQAVENWALIEGPVQAIRPSGVRDDLAAVEVTADTVEPHENFPNLFRDDVNAVVPVVVPATVVRQLELEPGKRVRLRARKASPSAVFADPGSVQVVT
jgi:hypothetical protein